MDALQVCLFFSRLYNRVCLFILVVSLSGVWYKGFNVKGRLLILDENASLVGGWCLHVRLVATG
jgi:hypothetical protein